MAVSALVYMFPLSNLLCHCYQGYLDTRACYTLLSLLVLYPYLLSQELRVNECGGDCAPRTRLPDTACRTASTDIAIKKVTWVNEVNSRVV
jgi:hypothetical protein